MTTATTESLAAWAARVAPTLDADMWRRIEDGRAYTLGGGIEARALLAERDRVAAGLTGPMRDVLAYGWMTATDSTLRAMQRRKLWVNPTGLTDFGREIARVLAQKETTQ